MNQWIRRQPIFTVHHLIAIAHSSRTRNRSLKFITNSTATESHLEKNQQPCLMTHHSALLRWYRRAWTLLREQAMSYETFTITRNSRCGLRDTRHVLLKHAFSCKVWWWQRSTVLQFFWFGKITELSVQIIDKGGNDPMTQADIAAQQLINGALLRAWPSLKIGRNFTKRPISLKMKAELDRAALWFFHCSFVRIFSVVLPS